MSASPKRSQGPGRLMRAYMGLIYLFLYLPIGVLIVYSFNSNKYSAVWKGFTWQWYTQLFNDSQLIQAALNSLVIAAVSATASVLIGTLSAVALWRYRFRGRQTLNGLLYVVMMSPDIIMAVALLAIFVALGINLGFWSLLIAHVTFCLPFVIITVYARLSGFNVQLLDAARDLGASEFVAFRRIIVPLLGSAILAGWLLAFTLSLDDVIVSFFVTGPDFQILPLKIYSMVRLGVKPEVNALASLLFVLSLILVAGSQWLLRDRKTD